MKKYYLIAIAVLLAGLFAYHFIAENRAEQQLQEAIREVNREPDARWTMQFSAIDISAFRGNIQFNDITFIQDQTIYRTKTALFDLSYLDFLRIYLGGIRFGLQYLDKATVSLTAPVYIDRNTLMEFKVDNLDISYTGNALDLLLHLNSGSPLAASHTVEAFGPDLSLTLPGTTFSQLKSAEFAYRAEIDTGNTSIIKSAAHQLELDSLTWTPSEEFQNTYGFFIKGFGYPTEAIPFESARLHTEPAPNTDLIQISATLKSELALLTASGNILPEDPAANSEWQQMELRLTEFSESFGNVLTNIERLLSITLPKENGGISLQLQGTLSNTSISQQPEEQ